MYFEGSPDYKGESKKKKSTHDNFKIIFAYIYHFIVYL